MVYKIQKKTTTTVSQKQTPLFFGITLPKQAAVMHDFGREDHEATAYNTVSRKNPCDYVFDDNLNSERPIGTVII